MTDTAYDVRLRIRSHVLRLLGDQLVGHDRLAIFELIKNSYDADSRNVDLTVDLKKRTIVAKDDGHGMTIDLVRSNWLDIGTPSKRGAGRVRSPRFMRLPLGEKGVGRLAVQKLGAKLQMVTRAAGAQEVVVNVTWPELIASSDFVDEALLVRVTERTTAKKFLGDATGTWIEVSELTRQEWSRKDLRDLKRLVVSLESPFQSVDSFNVALHVPGREGDIEDVPDLKALLRRAVWEYEFEISREGFAWSYHFSPPRLKSLTHRDLKSAGMEQLETCDEARREAKAGASSADEVPLYVDTKKAIENIGSVKGRVYVFYRRDEILRLLGDPRQTKQWLKEQAGVRVYRDGIRVYNYGEPEDDWLGLNARRINRPTAKLGTDQVVGAITLNLEASGGLKEKTNREGFNQDETFERLRFLVLSALEHLEKLHDPDRRAIDRALKGDEGQIGATIKVKDAISGLRKVCKGDEKLKKTVEPFVDAIEQEVEKIQSVMLNSGMAGVGLALVYHEIDRSIRALTALAESGVPAERLRVGLGDLRKMLDSISVLLRQGKARKLSIQAIVRQAIELNEARFRFHGVAVSAPILTGEEQDFFVSAPQHLVVSALNNLIDNAIYWACLRAQKDAAQNRKPAIRIATSWSDKEGGALAVADNGAGFEISPGDAVQPFVTRRTGGMGLGLYYCRLVMENIGGQLAIASPEEARDYVEIPPIFDGAAVTMLFGKPADQS